MKHGRDLQSSLRLSDKEQNLFRKEFIFKTLQGFKKKPTTPTCVSLFCNTFSRSYLDMPLKTHWKRKLHMHTVSQDSCF